VTLAEYVVGVDTFTDTIALLIRIAVTVRTALRNTDCVGDIESTTTATVAGTVLAASTCRLFRTVVFRVSTHRRRGTEIPFTTTQLTITAAVVRVFLCTRIVLAEPASVTARTCITGHGIFRELTLTGTVTGTTADCRVTRTLFIRILEGTDE
jgi:hypothetical protein